MPAEGAAVHDGHVDVRDNGIRADSTDVFQGFPAVGGLGHAKTVRFQQEPEGNPDICKIFDQKNVWEGIQGLRGHTTFGEVFTSSQTHHF